MRKLILLAVLPLACLAETQVMARTARPIDSTKIIHANDGDISEWTPGRFETDADTKVQYAVDHDADYLYVAMKFVDPQLQARVAMAGMTMFVDTRGKKKEGTGIEFPVRKEGGYGPPPTDDADLHQRMRFNMILMKEFGFDDRENKTHFIGEEGSANIAYNWDAQNNLCMEYKIPLAYVGDASSLKNKIVSVGWKVNDAPPFLTGWLQRKAMANADGGSGNNGGTPADPNAAASNGRGNAMSAGGRGRGTGGGGAMRADMSSVGTPEVRGQYVWTKHTMNF